MRFSIRNMLALTFLIAMMLTIQMYWIDRTAVRHDYILAMQDFYSKDDAGEPYEVHGLKIEAVYQEDCTQVLSGDTIAYDFSPGKSVIRFESIVCPIGDQPFAQAAKEYTTKHCLGKTVQIYGTREGGPSPLNAFFNFSFAFVSPSPSRDVQDLSALLLSKGLARVTEDCNNSTLLAIEATARKENVGIWASDKAGAK